MQHVHVRISVRVSNSSMLTSQQLAAGGAEQAHAFTCAAEFA
jgi:hypothetical protein